MTFRDIMNFVGIRALWTAGERVKHAYIPATSRISATKIEQKRKRIITNAIVI